MISWDFFSNYLLFNYFFFLFFFCWFLFIYFISLPILFFFFFFFFFFDKCPLNHFSLFSSASKRLLIDRFQLTTSCICLK